MGIMLTERAAAEVKKVMDEQKYGPEYFLRVGVAGGGCSGFSYKLMFDDKFNDAEDKRGEQHGVQVVVDLKSDLYLDGAKLDFYEGLEKRGFTFENPNAMKSCGCGSSFSA
jgi:iron-sulfur cluster assembly protein